MSRGTSCSFERSTWIAVRKVEVARRSGGRRCPGKGGGGREARRMLERVRGGGRPRPVRVEASWVRAVRWRRHERSMWEMESSTGAPGVEQRVQAELMEEASAALAKRLRTVPVRERPMARRERRTCWPWVSVE